MNTMLTAATDARQTAAWGRFLTAIGWKVETIARDSSVDSGDLRMTEPIYIFIRKVPFFSSSFIKIQHPKGPFPLKKIEAFAKAQNAFFLILEPHHVGFKEEDFKQAGYSISKLRYAHSATILIDLRKSEKELWGSFSENARRNIRKAEKNIHVEINSLQEKNRKDQIRRFYDLYTYLGKQKKFYVPPYAEVRAKMEAFAKTSVLLWAYERTTPHPDPLPQGERENKLEPIAVLWVGSVGKTLIYFHPGNTERGYELLANYLLVWEAMQWGKKQKLSFFDFETAYDPRYPFENKQWRGYTEFKKKFGGEFVEFPPSYIKFYNPVMKLLYQFGTMFSR